MRIEIEIPKEFEKHFNHDKFKDSFERIMVDIKHASQNGDCLCTGRYEYETIEMLEKAFENSKLAEEPDEQQAVYFELNNWTPGEDYPAEEPFLTWIGNDLNIYFGNENWVKENRLCVVHSKVDMSENFCITATKEWVEANCPRLLTKYTRFLRYPNEDGYVLGQFDNEFLKYSEENIGIEYVYDED